MNFDNTIRYCVIKLSFKNILKSKFVFAIKLISVGLVFTACSEQVGELKKISRELTSSVSEKVSSFSDKSADLMQNASNIAIELRKDNKIDDVDNISKDLVSILEEIPESYIDTNNNTVNLEEGLWKSVTHAVKNNEGYQAAILLEDEAMSKVGVAKSVRRTQFTGQSTIGGIYESGGNNNVDTKGVAGNLNITKLLYDGGKSVSNINQASAYALSLQANRRNLGNRIASDAGSSWINIWYMKERLNLMNTRTKKLNTLIDKMERMSLSGMIDMSVIDSSKSQLVDISLEKNKLEADFEATKVRFFRYFSQEPDDLSEPSFLLSPEKTELEIQNWRKAPILEKSVADLIVARNEVLGAESAFKPSATARAGINTPMKDGESTDKSIGVLLEYTFGDGGRRDSRLKAANAKLKSAESQLKDTQLMLQAELNSTLLQLNAMNNSMSLLGKKIKLNDANVKTTKSQLNTGQSTLEALIKAEISSFNSNNKYFMMQAERHALLLKIVTLSGALGRNLNF
jgi:outer membrane protein, adhesin transport system